MGPLGCRLKPPQLLFTLAKTFSMSSSSQRRVARSVSTSETPCSRRCGSSERRMAR
ncbi:MAG: hypothetical protein GU356_01355 [Pyrobaculum sp.]|nr:hypothetical protein [Pyrobaculum sp.]